MFKKDIIIILHWFISDKSPFFRKQKLPCYANNMQQNTYKFT